MDYHEAIEYMRKELHKQCVNSEGQDAYIIAISAMQEMMEYHKTGLSPKQVADTICELNATKRILGHYKQLGTLEEVREAVEKQKECKDCGYKIHSDRISELNSCNDCGLTNICEKRPEYGQYCRINCYDWRRKNDR